MTVAIHLAEEFSVGPARLRVDYRGSEPRDHILEDMNFLNYRLAEVSRSPAVTLEKPDVLWNREGEKSVSYDGHAITFSGRWAAGPLQKAVVAMLALRLEAQGLHPFHASAVRYRGKTVMFLGGESNHGKSMGQIEACRRGGLLERREMEPWWAALGSRLSRRWAGRTLPWYAEEKASSGAFASFIGVAFADGGPGGTGGQADRRGPQPGHDLG